MEIKDVAISIPMEVVMMPDIDIEWDVFQSTFFDYFRYVEMIRGNYDE